MVCENYNKSKLRFKEKSIMEERKHILVVKMEDMCYDISDKEIWHVYIFLHTMCGELHAYRNTVLYLIGENIFLNVFMCFSLIIMSVFPLS